MYGATPPVVLDVAVPLQLPKHNAAVLERLGTIAGGELTVTVPVAVQPFESVMVME